MKIAEIIEANINQQLSRFRDDGSTYRGKPMPHYDDSDIFQKYELDSYDDNTDIVNYDVTGIANQDPSINIDNNSLKAAIKNDLQILSPKQQQVLKMRFFQELTHEQIAEYLGVTRSRIRQIEAQAIRKLHKNKQGQVRNFI